MNASLALDKDYEGLPFHELIHLKVIALQGIGAKTEASLKQLNIETITDLGTWEPYVRAKALTVLAETEKDGDRSSESRMQLDFALKKKSDKLSFNQLVDSPLSVFKDCEKKVDTVLNSLNVKSIRDLATWKYSNWAEAICNLASEEETARGGASSIVFKSPGPVTPAATTHIQHQITSPNTIMALQVGDYKNVLHQLNERLHYYIDLIRDRDDTITELNANMNEMKNSHLTEITQVNSSHRIKLEMVQAKVNDAVASQVRDLEGQISKLQEDLDDLRKSRDLKDAEAKSYQKQKDQLYLECESLRKELEALKKDGAKREKRLKDQEHQLVLKTDRTAKAESELVLVKEKYEQMSLSMANDESIKQAALDQQRKQFMDDAKKTREMLLANMNKELEGQKKRLFDEYAAKETERAEKSKNDKDRLEMELRRTTEQLTSSQAKAGNFESELKKLNDAYNELRTQYQNENVELKHKLSHLEQRLSGVSSAHKISEDELGRLMGESFSMLKEIDRYSEILTSEEERLGITSPGSTDAEGKNKKAKRRRLAGTPQDQAGTFASPAVPQGATEAEKEADTGGYGFASLRKAVKPFSNSLFFLG